MTLNIRIYLRVCIPSLNIRMCMYTLYNDFKYKNTYLHVCIPYIRINTFVYVYLI